VIRKTAELLVKRNIMATTYDWTQRKIMVPEQEEIALSTTDLRVFYNGTKEAIHGVTMAFPKNEITALIGPSGSGKSTYLRALNRMNDTIDGARVTGEINYEGVNINDAKVNVFEVRKQIGMVFQRPNPFPKSIYENIAFIHRREGVKDKKKLDEIVETSLKQAALWDQVKDNLNKSALAMSGGQAQRLCIARALSVKPEIILMDEPASALDPISTMQIEETMMELKKNYTIIIVTHNMAQASRASDNTAFFYSGDLIEYDKTSTIFTQPSLKSTEDYVSGHFG
jgi:phosphate transport system ATP-binding protein